MKSFTKCSKAIIYLCRFIFFISIIHTMWTLRWEHLILLIGSLLLTYVPEIYTKWTKVHIPIGAKLFYIVFIFAAQWLGSYRGFYGHLFFWDVLLHGSSGVFIGYVALIILISLDRDHTLFKQDKKGVIIAFILAVGIAGAGIWEIIEFTGDTFLNTNAQLGSLQDTMEDIICGTLGACVFAIYIGIVLKTKAKSCVDELLKINSRKTNKSK